MLTRSSTVSRIVWRTPPLVMALSLLFVGGRELRAQNLGFNNRSVGGIAVDPEGWVQNAQRDDLGALSRLRVQSLDQIPKDLAKTIPLRKVSLRQLEAAITSCAQRGEELPPEVQYLAGLQGIHYVFVYPAQQDIVLVGPAEGWRVDQRGSVVGATTGWPVMQLDDLLVALRTARQAARGGISCSIDPTSEGMTALRNYVATLRTIGNARQTVANIEKTLGPQQITVTGVPGDSHFARVLVAADFRMKRLAMNLDPTPIPGLPSFMAMLKAGPRGMKNMLPRWWLEPNYQPLLRSPDGLAWEFRGAAVKAVTENDFLNAQGQREHTGRADPLAQRWADTMTRKYDELAVADPIFGQLRNCMELAIVGALISKEKLAEKADYNITALLNPAEAKTAQFPAPKLVSTQASVLKKGRNWIISASGGVLMHPWTFVEQAQSSDAPAEARKRANYGAEKDWWWN